MTANRQQCLSNDARLREFEREQANKTAIRYVFYWTLGVIALLGSDMTEKGVATTNWIPLVVALIVLLAVGAAYFRATPCSKVRRDAVRKLTDPTYE